MGQQIIKQPDGRLAVFSMNIDRFVARDMTADELIDWRVSLAAEHERQRTCEEIGRVLTPGERLPYFQFTISWERAVELDCESRKEGY